MDRNVRDRLRDLPGIAYEYSESGTVVKYWDVNIFKLNTIDGGIEIAYIDNLSKLDQISEERMVELIKCYLGWD